MMFRFGKRLVLFALPALAAGCAAVPASAPLDEGDIIDSGMGPGEPKNVSRFHAFLAVTGTGGEDAVRIVQTTPEGRPVYIDIRYADGKYVVYRETADDPDGSGGGKEAKRERAAECEELKRVDRTDDIMEFYCDDFRFLIEDVKE